MRYFFKGLTVIALILNSNCNYPSGGSVDQSVAMHFIKLVQKRNYLVHRLEKPIKSLLKFYEISQKEHHFNVWDFFDFHQHHAKNVIVKTGLSEHFLHPVVKRCVRDMEEKNDIQAIHRLWSDFLSYKFIESDLFVRETITAIILLYKDILLHAISMQIKSDYSLNVYRDMYADEQVDGGIQENYTTNSNEDLYDNFNSIVNLLNESYEEGDFVVNNNMRFYHIHRLSKSIIVLSKLVDKHADYSANYTYDFTQLPFENKAIQFYVEKMKRTHSLAPFFRLWHSIISYKYINDAQFLREFSILLYIVHKRISADFSGIVVKDGASIHEMIQLYETIATMPIPDLLNSLDAVVDQCIEIIEKYELDSSMSWRAWFKKYWWMPPVVIASIGINFVLKNKFNSDAQIAE